MYTFSDSAEIRRGWRRLLSEKKKNIVSYVRLWVAYRTSVFKDKC